MSLGQSIKNLMEKIPGYRGYAEREDRREADKELRDSVAAAFSSQVTRITRVQEQLINNGDFDTASRLDGIIGRMQHLADRVRTASYGFTGFWDDDVVDTAVLDRLYAFDLEMANGIEQVGDLIAQVGLRESRDQNIEALEAKLDELHETFSQRGHLINTFPQGGSFSQPGMAGSTSGTSIDSDTISTNEMTMRTNASPETPVDLPPLEPAENFLEEPLGGENDLPDPRNSSSTPN
jgi:hypothetical protein